LQGEPVSVNPVQSDPALSKQAPLPTLSPDLDIPDLPPIEPLVPPDPLLANPTMSGAENPPQPVPVPSPVASQPIEPIASSPSLNSRTQLQTHAARLLHVQTDRLLELPANLSVIHLGKPNDRIPPDIDVSGFPNSEIVSRIHADIRVEGDIYYIEDVGSSNGTYVNNTPLPPGNRHRLRSGDRIALGKGDKVTFLFQMT
jgi:pSer/pThr/pTyr-binding forkhead associated (FHA) protein